MKSIFAAAIALSISFSSLIANSYPLMPNPQWAKGSLCDRSNSDYETNRYAQKIPYCRRNVQTDLKRQLYDRYNIPEECRNRYTIDHIIPLSIGGDNSAENLWPEHKDVKATRAMLEEEVFVDVRDNHMTQKEAVELVLKTKFTAKVPNQGSSHCDKPDRL